MNTSTHRMCGHPSMYSPSQSHNHAVNIASPPAHVCASANTAGNEPSRLLAVMLGLTSTFDPRFPAGSLLLGSSAGRGVGQQRMLIATMSGAWTRAPPCRPSHSGCGGGAALGSTQSKLSHYRKRSTQGFRGLVARRGGWIPELCDGKL